MTELLKNAWLGWRDMTTPGKLAGVWLVALCYLLYHIIIYGSFYLYVVSCTPCF